MNVYWPPQLVPQSAPADPIRNSVVGPASLSGFRQAVSSLATAWRLSYVRIPIHTPARINLARALSAQIDGPVTPVIATVFDRRALKPFAAADDLDVVLSGFGDGGSFGDGSMFSQPGIAVAVSASAARLSTTLSLALIKSSALVPGMQFSIGVRLYRIGKIVDQSASAATVEVWPPLREAVLAGATCEFVLPQVKCRLTAESSYALGIDFGRVGYLDVQFIEDPN